MKEGTEAVGGTVPFFTVLGVNSNFPLLRCTGGKKLKLKLSASTL